MLTESLRGNRLESGQLKGQLEDNIKTGETGTKSTVSALEAATTDRSTKIPVLP
jgi:hypothetical protein